MAEAAPETPAAPPPPTTMAGDGGGSEQMDDEQPTVEMACRKASCLGRWQEEGSGRRGQR